MDKCENITYKCENITHNTYFFNFIFFSQTCDTPGVPALVGWLPAVFCREPTMAASSGPYQQPARDAVGENKECDQKP